MIEFMIGKWYTVETKIDRYATETINTYNLEEAKAYCEEKTQQGYVSKCYMQTE